jgi:hypothetical protein
MKKTIIVIAAILMTGFTTNLMAQYNTDFATASAAAKIVKTIEINKVADMNFGTMSTPSAPATVILSPLGGRTPSGPEISLLSQAPTALASSYTTVGDNNAAYSITLPANGSINVTSGANTMAITDFTCSEPLTTAFSVTGTGAFTVGAKLNLAANQPAGSYTGSFDVTIAYN